MDINEEIQRCKDDPVYFMEKYILVNGKRMVLRESDKAFIKWFFQIQNNPVIDVVLLLKTSNRR